MRGDPARDEIFGLLYRNVGRWEVFRGYPRGDRVGFQCFIRFEVSGDLVTCIVQHQKMIEENSRTGPSAGSERLLQVSAQIHRTLRLLSMSRQDYF